MIRIGLIRSEIRNTWGATKCPSSCCRPTNSKSTHRALIGSLNSATRIAGNGPMIGPMYGMNSISP